MKWDKTAARNKNLKDKRTGGSGGGAVAGGVGGFSILGILLYLIFGIGDGSNPIPDAGAIGGGQVIERSIDDPTTLDEPVEFYVNAITSDVGDFWVDTFAEYDVPYNEPSFVLFDTPINTACGGATAAIGPHYCALNSTIYLELGFFDVMERQLGATGDFAPAYVIAHEYAHHVQSELGISGWMREESARNPSIRNELSIRLELQADCLAGVWASGLSSSANQSDRTIWNVTEEDIREAINAAASVGDDRIQEQSGARINKESWTHGSSEQRMAWFLQGFQTADTEQCETFDGL